MISEALIAYTKRPRIEFVREWPGQSVLCVTQKYWTTFIHEAIRKGGNALREYLEVNNDQINDIVTLVRGKLSKQNRTTLQVCAILKLTQALFFVRQVADFPSASYSITKPVIL